MTRQTRKDVDKMNNKDRRYFTAYIALGNMPLSEMMKTEIVSLRRSPPTGVKSVKVSIRVQEVLCQKCS